MHALRPGELSRWVPGLFSSRLSGIPVLRLQAGLQWKVKLPLLRLVFLQQALYLFSSVAQLLLSSLLASIIYWLCCIQTCHGAHLRCAILLAPILPSG